MTSIYLFALVAGAWVLQQQAILPDLTGATALVPLAVLWSVVARRSGAANRVFSHSVGIAAFAVGGFFWAAANGAWKLADDLPEIWEGRDVEIAGVIAEMVQRNDRGVRLLLDVERTYTLDAKIPSRISLMWYATDDKMPPELHAGQRWRMPVRLHRPHGNANPNGFDFEAAGVIVALAIGDQQAIPPDQWQVFTRTGVNHLMSISGLHITMVASMVFLLVQRLWRRSETLILKLPAVRAATVCGLVVALAYAALSGFAVPAQRTVYMLAVVAFALWSGWTARPFAVLATAAALAVVLDPMAVIAPGFWLSFGAVAVIMFAAGSRIGRQSWFRFWAKTQWAVTLALIPFLLAMFQQVSLVSPVANAFAIPLVSLIVVPLALAASVLPLDWIAHFAHLVMAMCMFLLRALSDLPDAVWQQHAPAAWTIPIALAGALWMLLPKGFPGRWVGAVMMSPLSLSIPEKLAPGELRVTVLDVGQGLAVVVRSRDHALLYDAGPAFTEQIDAGGRIVVPYLRSAGISTLDGMIVSHDDTDHSGGALSVLRGMPVGWLATSLPRDHSIRMAAIRSRFCNAGERWEWDGVSFEFLHPQAREYNEPDTKDNDRSCVLRVNSVYGSLFLPGDIEKRSESRLLQAPQNLRTDILIAPHHGSRTSSTTEFVQAVAPGFTVFSVGYRNRFGHPHPAVSARYRQAGSRMLGTDGSGALIIDMNPAGIGVQRWREVDRKYWAGR